MIILSPKILFFLGFIVFQSIFSGYAVLLSSPPLISEQDVRKKEQSATLAMNWTVDKASLGFDRKHGKIALKIQFMEKFPEELSPFKEKFSFSLSQGTSLWTFAWPDLVSPSDCEVSLNAPPSLEEAMGIVYPPRVLVNKTPQKLDLLQLADLIKDKKCVFYTGAGISAGAVPTMLQLMEKLHLMHAREKGNFLAAIETALKDPQSYISPINDFCNACLFGQPTLAHIAIRNITKRKNWGLLTENLDLLHQRSGINPLHHAGPNWLTDHISKDDLKKIDVIITVGLASDESGFLAWFKAYHPEGKIISLDLKQPNYLDEDDFFLQDDVQKSLPELSAHLI
ncbi:MAG: hypothetical protein ACK5PQ_00095 [Alphaproteobacteria bacterium]